MLSFTIVYIMGSLPKDTKNIDAARRFGGALTDCRCDNHLCALTQSLGRRRKVRKRKIAKVLNVKQREIVQYPLNTIIIAMRILT
jgi:hypothetical protein